MSTVKTNNVQVGQSVTATNNFTWYQPASPDGTVRLGNGNSGSVTDLVTLTSAGNLGIGTSSPSFPNGTGLAVYNSTVPRIKLANSTTGDTATDGTQLLVSGSDFYIQQREAASVIIATNGSDRVTIDSSGNLGLGVTPSGWYASGVGWKALQVGAFGLLSNTATNDSRLMSNAYLNTGGSYIYLNSSQNATNYIQSAGVHSWYTAPSGTAGNVISFTQAMTLDASGNWSVGNTGIGLSNNNSIQYSVSNAQGYITHVNGTGSGQGYWIFGYNGSTIGTIVQNGTTGVTYNTSSDQRLKENIVDAPNALDSVNAIKVRSFDWKSDGSHVDYGYIAQELLTVAPESVSVPPDPDEMMGVDFGKLTPRLVKAIQELSAELNDLKQKVNA